MTGNPYEAPQDLSGPQIINASPEDAHEIRLAHIKHEASVRSIGILYYLGATFLLFTAIGSLGGGIKTTSQPDVGALAGTVSSISFIAISIFQFFVALEIRKLKPWARIAGIVISIFGLLAFPIGTLISAYIIYLLLCKKGRTIFSAEYKDVIAATPDVKYKTSKVVWIVLAVVVLIIVGLGAFFAIGSR